MDAVKNRMMERLSIVSEKGAICPMVIRKNVRKCAKTTIFERKILKSPIHF